MIFERAGVTCLRADVVFDASAQAERFGTAFTQWAKDRPAKQTRNDKSVVFESCDPGPAAALTRAPGQVSGIEGLALRKALVAGAQAAGAPPQVATCTIDGVLERLTANRVAEIDNALRTDPKSQAGRELQRAIAQVAPGCR